MKGFCFSRFVRLLLRVLEIGMIGSLVLRWVDATLGFWSGITIPRGVYDVMMNFSVLAIFVLGLVRLWLLFTRQPRASMMAMRTILYVVAFCVSPARLGSTVQKTAERPSRTISKRLEAS